MSEQWYFSTVTQKWRCSFVYTPPDYDRNAKAKFPVLYLLHARGEDETGWYTQGHVDAFMDNLSRLLTWRRCLLDFAPCLSR